MQVDYAFEILGVFRRERRAPVREIPPHEHTSFVYHLSGNTRYCLEDGVLLAEQGSVVVVPEGVGYRTERDAPAQVVVVRVKAYKGNPDRVELFRPEVPMGLQPAFITLADTWADADHGYRVCCQSLFSAILYRIARQQQDRVLAGLGEPMRRAVNYLNTHFADPKLSLSDVAAMGHMSEGHFRACYHKLYGVSPWAGVTAKRIAYAKKLLGTGLYTNAQIAEMAGYANPKYFITAFRKATGITPGRYLQE
ncbi:MAG: AraC family transcriptional regulator [Eubacteriales bacterium]